MINKTFDIVKDFFYEPGILTWIEKMFDYTKQREWYKTYWFIDVHGVISKPDYRKSSQTLQYYDYAMETLKMLTEREDIILVLFTSSYPDEINFYTREFDKVGVVFDYINENPEISISNGCYGFYDKKPYFNVLMDDKAGFNPEKDWKYLYKYFKKTKYRPDPNWTFKKDEKYHAKS